MGNSDNQISVTESIRESLMLFIIKIASVLIVSDLFYAVLNFVLLSLGGKFVSHYSKHLVHHQGIMNCIEKIYDLNIVRSVSIRQSWFGKIFRYGTVNIEISASGGYTDQVTLFGVSNPQQYEKILRRHF